MLRKSRIIFLAFTAIALIQIAFHWNVFNKELSGIHTTRQCQTQWNIQNFYRYDNNILNPRIAKLNHADNLYRYEFPLMQWLIAQIYHVGKEQICISRIGVFVFFLLGVLGFMQLLSGIGFNLWTIIGLGIAYSFSPALYYYAVNPLPDVFALMASQWYLVFLYAYYKSPASKNFVLAALFLSLASLSKLPFILFGAGLGLLMLLRIKKSGIRFIYDSILLLLILLPVISWYLWVIPGWKGNGITTGVLAEHMDWAKYAELIKYHATWMFPFRLLNPGHWLLLLTSIWVLITRFRWSNHMHLACLSIFGFLWLYFFFELNMIGTAHDYYLFPFLPFLFLLLGFGTNYLLLGSYNWAAKILLTTCVIASAGCTYQLTIDDWNPSSSVFNPDLYNYKEQLRNAVPDDKSCIILQDNTFHVFAYLIDKQGYIFKHNELRLTWISDLIHNKGIEYIYSDEARINEDPIFQEFVEDTVLIAGTIQVYKLKENESVHLGLHGK